MMAAQASMLLASATPIPSSPMFELRAKKRRQRRLMAQEQQQRAAQEAEEEARSDAFAYVVDFLHASEWSTQMDNISVVWDVMPTLDTLETYGNLGEQDGTVACRRLFKAAVIWDQLGHALWLTLRELVEQKRMALASVVESASWTSMNGRTLTTVSSGDNSVTTNGSRRSSRRTSEDSMRSEGSSFGSDPTAGHIPHRGSIPRMLSRFTARR